MRHCASAKNPATDRRTGAGPRPARGLTALALLLALSAVASAGNGVAAAPGPPPAPVAPAAPATPAAPITTAARAPVAPLIDGLASPAVPRASAKPRAQRYFAQGMMLVWSFNPAEAARSFAAATAADPACALCYWGLAWSLGPNINADMQAADAGRVRDALASARRLAPRASPRDRALIDALSLRHPPGGDPAALDEEGYAERMRAVAKAFPRDADVATLAAEAVLNLHPYDWWKADGAAQPWTPEIRAQLARAMQLEPQHAGANHYWIHLMESSPHPDAARASADRLRTLVPGSGHLLHMPSHIDMRTGRYADAVAANERSIAADARYLEQVDAQGAYRIGYVAHNQHFLWAAAAMEGRSAVALAAARTAYPAACGPGRSDRSTGILQHYYVLPIYALVRFGRWREILEETLPPDVAEPYPLAVWHYARGTAYAKTGRVDAARRELAAVEALAADPKLASARIKNINAASALVDIARLTLAADIALAEGRNDDAVVALTRATAIEDGLSYDEPHLWLAPTRHALGAALLAAGRAQDAARVYREDLAHYPDNGWSLAGLAIAQRRLGDDAAAAATEARYRAAWREADVELTGSRF
jgi:tetratricopeptide (TPR) repeat protein